MNDPLPEAIRQTAEHLLKKHEEGAKRGLNRFRRNKSTRFSEHDLFLELGPLQIQEGPFREYTQLIFNHRTTDDLRQQLEWFSMKGTPVQDAPNVPDPVRYAMQHYLEAETKLKELEKQGVEVPDATSTSRVFACWAIVHENIMHRLQKAGAIMRDKGRITIQRKEAMQLRRIVENGWQDGA